MYPMFHMTGAFTDGFGHMDGAWGGFYGIGNFIMMLVFWILLIVGIVFLLRWLKYHSKDGLRGRSAMEILKKRYAKGEIDKKDFEEMRKDLE